MNSLVSKGNNSLVSKIINFFKSIFKKNTNNVTEQVEVVTESNEDIFLPEVYSEDVPTEKVENKDTNKEVLEVPEDTNNLYKVSVDTTDVTKEAKRKQVLEQIRKNPKLLDDMTLNEIERINNYINKISQN